MAQAEGTRTLLYADREHGGIRFSVPVVLFGVAAIVFVLLRGFLASLAGGIAEYALLLSCLGALLSGLGIASLVEYALKKVWPSGRSLAISERGIEVTRSENDTTFFEWTKRLTVSRWYFSLKGYPRGGRERRVPASWYCLACQLQQDEHRLVVYCLASAGRASAWTHDGSFLKLSPADLFHSGSLGRLFSMPTRPELPTSILAGKDGPYWLAERRRWFEGLELTDEDFGSFMKALDRNRGEL